jgi:hypothetical protein
MFPKGEFSATMGPMKRRRSNDAIVVPGRLFRTHCE